MNLLAGVDVLRSLPEGVTEHRVHYLSFFGKVSNASQICKDSLFWLKKYLSSVEVDCWLAFQHHFLVLGGSERLNRLSTQSLEFR